MNIKIPTYEDFYNHTGLHYHQLWKEVGDAWYCPACGRSKFQIMKWTKISPGYSNALMGWVAALHKHHDHSVGHRRFDQTIICGQCNSADGVAKRKLKLPSDFSFSPNEIRSFVQALPHGSHKIDYDLALSIYSAHQSKPKPLFWDL